MWHCLKCGLETADEKFPVCACGHDASADEHESSGDCWCHPKVFYENMNEALYVHKGPGEPPADLIAQELSNMIERELA